MFLRAIVVCFFVFVLSLLTSIGQRHFIYLHTISWPPLDFSLPPSQPQWPFFDGIPNAESFRVGHMGCWYIPGNGTKHVVVYFHGAGANRAYPHRLRLYHRLSHYAPTVSGVYACDYSGFAGQEGVPSVAQLRRDGMDIVRAVEGREHPNASIVLWGHSLGSYFAAYVAAAHRNNNRIAGLVMESAFTSAARVPVHNLAIRYDISEDTVADFVSSVLLHDTDMHDTLSVIPNVTVPVFFLHGDSDWVVPSCMSAQLSKALAGRHELVFLEGAGHNDCVDHGRFDDVVAGFLVGL